MTRSRLVALAAIGAVAGTLAEGLHLRTGVWALSDAGAFPWWIAAVYFFGFLGFGLALRRFGPPLEVRPGRLGLELAAFAALLLAPSAMPEQELAMTALATGWVALRLVAFRAPGDVPLALGAAAANLAIEWPLVALVGLYRYPSAHFLAVPLWLFPFWAGLGLGLRRFFSAAAGTGGR
ncbi:MAG TPA: hypothetical protein VGK67_06205 [Myxococcales bacterium]